MKILIYGLGKSGTTILLYKIKTALEKKFPGEDFQLVFEPLGYDFKDQSFELADGHKIKMSDHCLCKALMPNIHNPGFAYDLTEKIGFDKRIMIVRDPRDRWLSSFFYRWFRFAKEDINQFHKALELLELKEKHPGAFPMFALNGFHYDDQKLLLEQQSRLCEEPMGFAQNLNQEDWVIFRYEDLIDENFEALNSALSLELGEGEVSENLSRVARSKKYGEWRTWFTDEDVRFFKPVFSAYLKFFGYDPDDWKLNYPEIISPENGSGYIRRITKADEPKKERTSYLSRFKRQKN